MEFGVLMGPWESDLIAGNLVIRQFRSTPFDDTVSITIHTTLRKKCETLPQSQLPRQYQLFAWV